MTAFLFSPAVEGLKLTAISAFAIRAVFIRAACRINRFKSSGFVGRDDVVSAIFISGVPGWRPLSFV